MTVIFSGARECYDKAIGSRGCSFDAFYRRGIAEVQLGDFPAAVVDLEYVVSTERKYDSHRAAGLLAHAYANTGEPAKAEALFEEVTRISTLSETYYNYASLLAEQHRTSEAREWSQTNPRQEANYARLFAAARAALVSQGQWLVEAAGA